jgi:hypothetical protein
LWFREGWQTAREFTQEIAKKLLAESFDFCISNSTADLPEVGLNVPMPG